MHITKISREMIKFENNKYSCNKYSCAKKEFAINLKM